MKELNHYPTKIEFIKNEFINYYKDKGPENGILQGPPYHGCATHCRNCLATITKMIKPRSVLEIGSWHYESSEAIAKAMDEVYGKEGPGFVDSFDIREGGYDGKKEKKPDSKRINPYFWYPHHTNYDTWKYSVSLPFETFRELNNEQISEKNIKILEKVARKNSGVYDLIFIDGDHSFEGVQRDFNICKKFANEETLFVIDNIWDKRLIDVRKFFDQLPFIKWDFKEWNDSFKEKNQVQDTGVFLLK